MEEKVKFEDLLELLRKHEGRIVIIKKDSDLSSETDDFETQNAKLTKRFFEDEEFVYIWQPIFVNLFPETDEEIELFEKCYVKSEVPEHLFEDLRKQLFGEEEVVEKSDSFDENPHNLKMQVYDIKPENVVMDITSKEYREYQQIKEKILKTIVNDHRSEKIQNYITKVERKLVDKIEHITVYVDKKCEENDPQGGSWGIQNEGGPHITNKTITYVYKD